MTKNGAMLIASPRSQSVSKRSRLDYWVVFCSSPAAGSGVAPVVAAG
jgi:hypothetical protein